MGHSVKLSAAQRAAGQPLDMGLTLVSDDSGDTPIGIVGLGVTLTAARPATIGNLPVVDSCLLNGTTLGNRRATISAFGPKNDAPDRIWRQVITWTVRQPLNTDWVAGRYVWAFAVTATTPEDSVDLVHLSGPYRIH